VFLAHLPAAALAAENAKALLDLPLNIVHWASARSYVAAAPTATWPCWPTARSSVSTMVRGRRSQAPRQTKVQGAKSTHRSTPLPLTFGACGIRPASCIFRAVQVRC
jgi:uncharacterized protein (DUF2126 family)